MAIPNDGQEFVATTSQGNYLSFHGGSGCLGLKFGGPIDGTSRNCDDIARVAACTHGVIVVLITIETSEISIGVSINSNVCRRLNDHSLVFGSDEVATNPFDCNFVWMLRIEHELGHLTITVC
jgi:hypothetical protein